MGCLTLGNCGSCWSDPCTCGQKSYTETSLGFMRTDELEALQAKITRILASRKQKIGYSTDTQQINPLHRVVSNMSLAHVLTTKHKD